MPIPGSISFTNFRIEYPNGSTYPLSVSPATQTVTIGAFPSTQTLTVSLGALPLYVSLGTIKGTITATSTQDVYQYAPNFQLFIPSGYPLMIVSASFEKIYTTESTPTGVQEMPWTDLLEKTYGYAFGYSGSSNVAAALTRGRHADSSWNYDPNTSKYVEFIQDNSGNIVAGVFDLKSAVQDSPGQTVNCFSVAFFLAVAMKSQGIPATTAYFVEANHPLFLTAPLAPIGGDNPQLLSSYQPNMFSSHGITVRSGLVYDATSASLIGLDGLYSKQPAQGQPLPQYWQSTNPTQMPYWPSPYVGLAQSYSDSAFPITFPLENPSQYAGWHFDVTQIGYAQP